MKNKFLSMKKLIDKYIYDKRLSYVLIFFISLIIPTILVLHKGEFWNSSDLIIYSVECLLVLINLYLIIFNIIRRNFRIEHIFLNLMIPIGCMYLVCLIPNCAYDEGAHAYRTYVITQGHFITDRTDEKTPKMEVPRELIDSLEIHTYKELVTAIKTKTDYDDVVLVGNDGVGASNYSFVNYIFPAIGMSIGNIFNINIVLSYYLARVVSFIAFLILSFFTIRKLPFGKMVMFVYLFNPILIQQCVSISADNIVNSISFLIVAFIINKLFSKEKITNKELGIMGVLSCLLGILKYVYFPLTFIMLLLIKNNPEKKKKIIGIIFVSILCAVVTYFCMSLMYSNPNSHVLLNGIDSGAQLKFILNNPFRYLMIILKTTIKNFEFYFFTFFGRHLGNFTIHLTSMVSIIYAFILLLSPVLENNKFEFKKTSKLWIVIVILMIYGLIETGLYLLWTKVGANIVEGIQGRYFIPFAFLIPMLFITKKNELHFKNRNFWVCTSLLFLNLVALYTIFRHFNY